MTDGTFRTWEMTAAVFGTIFQVLLITAIASGCVIGK